LASARVSERSASLPNELTRKEEADTVLTFLRQWTAAAGLTLHPRLVNATREDFDFLGWHIRGSKKGPRTKSLQKLREKLRPLTKLSTTDWRAGCGKSAHPVRREGVAPTLPFLPLSMLAAASDPLILRQPHLRPAMTKLLKRQFYFHCTRSSTTPCRGTVD
jgi:hypothetical protein